MFVSSSCIMDLAELSSILLNSSSKLTWSICGKFLVGFFLPLVVAALRPGATLVAVSGAAMGSLDVDNSGVAWPVFPGAVNGAALGSS